METQHFYAGELNKFFEEHVIGKTIVDIHGANVGSNHISFLFSDGSRMRMYHCQNCCELVEVDDICGDIDDLKDSPILSAEERLSGNFGTGYTPARDAYDSSYTWTFYKFRTQKGYVDIKWYGTSNGYYSECVDIEYWEPSHEEDWENVFQGY